MQTFTGLEYLKIDIANSYGLDKLNWDDRIAWFDANEADLDTLRTSAKEPAMFYAGCKAYADVLAGKPIGYMINLDATASGLQILAALVGDTSAARLCNVIDNGRRMDAYTAIHEIMQNTINDSQYLQRDNVKHAIMTSLFNSVSEPRKVFGEGTQLLESFYRTMTQEAPGAWELNQAMPTLWNPEAYSHDWILPDNFHVNIKVESTVSHPFTFDGESYICHSKVNMPLPSSRSLGANMVHSIDGLIVREINRRCDFDPEQINKVLDAIQTPAVLEPGEEIKGPNAKMVRILWANYERTGYLSARILDYIDERTVHLVDTLKVLYMMSSMPEKPFKVVSVHDCFRCLPHYGNDLRKQYNIQLALIARSNLLDDLLSQIVGEPVTFEKLNPKLYRDILSTNYALS
jgi:hypothetical protein